MATVAEKPAADTLADLLERIGNVPAERVLLKPPPGTAKEKDVVRYLEAANKRLVELVDGVLVEKAMGWKESMLASIVVQHLWNYLDIHDLGIALTADGPIRLRPGRVRIPDVCFISWARLPDMEQFKGSLLDAIPDLAVEVISKSNTPKEMDIKLRDYFKAGVRLVWFIYPKTETAMVYTSLTARKEVGSDGTLHGGKVLPGFSLPLKKLFSRARRRSNGRP